MASYVVGAARAVLRQVAGRKAGRLEWPRRLAALFAVSGLIGAALVAITVAAVPAAADPGPVGALQSTDVTADALPTAQINGVVWDQKILGNTVFVGGSFTNARPAGAAAGTNTSPRGNLMSYTLSTGAMTSWAPTANGQVLTMALSPDQSRLYVAGEFTTINGQEHNRIAAFDTSTGTLIGSFDAGTDATIKAIAVTSSAVYVGGSFSTADGVARSRLAAFDPTTGALMSWNPGADTTVWSMTTNPEGSLVIVGGAFSQIGSHSSTGLAALDPTSGAWVDWQASQTIQAWGQNNDGPGTGAAIYSLSHDATNVYGTAYNYYGYGNLEGAFSAAGDTGAVNWVEDCHGDTYGVYAGASAVYTVSHDHFCGDVGGYPQTNPWTFHRTLAFSKQATGTLAHNPYPGYYDWYGTPSPSLLTWFPDLTAGSYTGASQAAYSVTGNSQYVVEGGEFPKVNNTPQQGLVRFAVPSIAPNKQGPQVGSSQWSLSIQALSSTSAHIAFQANWDPDNRDLTYYLGRVGAGIVDTQTAASEFWNRPTLGFIDSGLTPGKSYTYYVKVTDSSGNRNYTSQASVVMPTAGTESQYTKDVYNDGAIHYWRLDDSGSTFTDWSGTDNMTVHGGVTTGTSSAIVGDPDTSSSFNGNNGYAAGTAAEQGPDRFSEEVWFRTDTTNGGKIIGFGDKNTGTSEQLRPAHLHGPEWSRELRRLQQRRVCRHFAYGAQ